MNVVNEPTLKESKQTDRRLIKRARDAAKATVKAYLKLAKSGGKENDTQRLEAIAIERAVIADTLGELAEKDHPAGEEPNCKQRATSIVEADERLFEASAQLYRRSGNREVKNFARDLRFSVFGFGQTCFLHG